MESFLKKTLGKNLNDGALASLFNADGELTDIDVLLTADKERVDLFKEEQRKQYSRGQKETLTKLEKELKTKYEVDSDLEGVELIDHIVSSNQKPGSLTDDDFVKHPKYAELKRAHEKELKAKEAEAQTRIDETIRTFKQKDVLSKISEKALVIFESMNPILSGDPAKALNQKKLFLKEFEAGKYDLTDDGNIVMLDKDGKPLEDPHGKLIQFEDHVKTVASDYFEFKTAQERTNAGNQQPVKTGAKIVIKDQNDFLEKSKAAKTPQERVELLTAWKEQQKGG